MDHTHILGSSAEQIAVEKGGIIKDGVPVVIGEASATIRTVFEALANEHQSPVIYAEDDKELLKAEVVSDGCGIYYTTEHMGSFKGELCGTYQIKNARTILSALSELVRQGYLCLPQSDEAKIAVQKEVSEGFLHVCQITGLRGRWETVGTQPTVICDIGHNVAAWEHLSKQLDALQCRQLHMVFGMVDDKDVYGVMSLMPKNAIYYFTRPTTKRALPELSLQVFGTQFGLEGSCYATVSEAFDAAIKAAQNNDVIFVGGSNYVVADFLKSRV